MVIHPYKHHPDSPVWVFDDPKHGLYAEPFVGQVNEMIDRLLESKGMSRDGKPYSFALLFSSAPLPDYDLHLEWLGATWRTYNNPEIRMRAPFWDWRDGCARRCSLISRRHPGDLREVRGKETLSLRTSIPS